MNKSSFNHRYALIMSFAMLIPGPAALADEPGRGNTAEAEVGFLKFAIDHHYGALRMTELAAGTQTTAPKAAISPDEGVSPTPNTKPTKAKADLPELVSLARRNNRMQREEILEAQMYLKDWYGITYQPKLTKSAAAMIQNLEVTPAGKSFDEHFMTRFSVHHAMIIKPASECMTGYYQAHPDLRRYCEGIWHSQQADIDAMRELLCNSFKRCGFVPFQPSETQMPE